MEGVRLVGSGLVCISRYDTLSTLDLSLASSPASSPIIQVPRVLERVCWDVGPSTTSNSILDSLRVVLVRCVPSRWLSLGDYGQEDPGGTFGSSKK